MPTWFRVLSILLTLAAIVVWIVLSVRNRSRWMYAIPPLVWLINLFLFFVAAYGRSIGLFDIDAVVLNVWSASISMLAVVITLGIGCVWYVWGTPYDEIK